MGLRGWRFVAALVCVVTVSAAACGGDSADESTADGTQGGGDSEQSTPSTESEAEAASETEPEAESESESETEPESEAEIDLPSYLAEFFDINADSLADTAAAGDDLYALADLQRDLVTRIESLIPPPEVAGLHQRWLADAMKQAAATDAFLPAIDSNDPAVMEEALDVFLLSIAEQVSESEAVARLHGQLAIAALEGNDDPMALYTAEMLELQSYSGIRLEQFFEEIATDPAAAIETLLEDLEDFALLSEAWADLDPPAGAIEIHQQRLELLDDQASMFATLRDAIENNTELPPGFVAQSQEINQRSSVLAAESARLTADVLRASDEVPSDLADTTTDLLVAESALLTTEDLSPGWGASRAYDDPAEDELLVEVASGIAACDGLEQVLVEDYMPPGLSAEAESPEFERDSADIEHSVVMFVSADLAAEGMDLLRGERLFECTRLLLEEGLHKLFELDPESPTIDSIEVEVGSPGAVEAGDEVAVTQIKTTIEFDQGSIQLLQEQHCTRIGRAVSCLSFTEVDPAVQEQLVLLAADRLTNALT